MSSTPDSLSPSPLLDWVVFAFVTTLGACIGSFLNVVCYRWPRKKSIVSPAQSYCPHCKTPIQWHDNLPILGYVLLGGRCRACRQRIAPRYPVVEAMAAGLFALTYWWLFVADAGPQWLLASQTDVLLLIARLVFIGLLLAIALYDEQTFEIPLVLSASLWGLGLLVALGPFSADATRLPALSAVDAVDLGPAVVAGVLGVLVATGLVKQFPKLGSFYIPPDLDAQLREQENRLFALAEARGWDPLNVKDDTQVSELMNELPAELRDVELPTFAPRRLVGMELGFLAVPVLFAVLGHLFWPATGWFGSNVGRQVVGAGLGFLVGGGLLWYTRLVFTFALNKEAMGLGDVHLMAGVGAVLGWYPALLGFFFGPVVAVPTLLIVVALRWNLAVPFGPWLCLGSYVAMLLGDYLWYSEAVNLDAAANGLMLMATEAGIGRLGLVLGALTVLAIAAGILALVKSLGEANGEDDGGRESGGRNQGRE